MSLSLSGKILAVLLILFIVCGILLTPLSGVETRPAADITTVGLISLSIFFVALALAVASILLLFRRPRLASILAVIGSLCFLPGFLADRTGNLSLLPAPVAIFYIEWVTVAIAILSILLALRVRREVAQSK